jgi:methylthioribose-1-phosphate isomerase
MLFWSVVTVLLANGDVANKIGTYNLALAARAHGVPFYVCAPSSSIDITTVDGDAITIEERPEDEITHFRGEPICAFRCACLESCF